MNSVGTVPCEFIISQLTLLLFINSNVGASRWSYKWFAF